MDWLRQRAAVTPHKLALIIADDAWRYDQLDVLTEQTARWLNDCGVQRGDLIAALLPSGLHYVCVIHALARLGATLLPLNTRLTLPELVWQLNTTTPPWLIHDTGESTRANQLKQATTARLSLLNVDHEKLALQREKLDVKREEPNADGNILFTLDDSPFTIDNSYFHLSNPQSIVFTSGTTGRPKGVVLTFANHFYSANASAYRLGLDPVDRWISALPLFHVGGLAVIFRSCLYGTAVILHPRFDLDAINHSLDVQRGTIISVVPTMLYRMLQSRTHWPTTLRLILVGGAAASPELVEAANLLPRRATDLESVDREQSLEDPSRYTPHPSPLVSTTYGLTEAASQVATQTPVDTASKPGSVGKPLMFTTVKIVDDSGRSLSQGEIGEIVVSGPTVMKAYFKQEEETQRALRNNYFHTGDMGYLDTDGDLWLVQRRSDLIVSGGENVYPAEVEAALRAHPGVAAVCVVGVPSTEWGQQVAAMVVLEAGSDLDEAALLAYGRARLAAYKQPRLVRFVDALPLTGSGKVHRRAVQEQLTLDK